MEGDGGEVWGVETGKPSEAKRKLERKGENGRGQEKALK